MREAFRRAGQAWDALRGVERTPAFDAASVQDAPIGDALEGLGTPSSGEEDGPSLREQLLNEYRNRLVALHKAFGTAPDVDVLLRELAALHPGAIHQPMGAAHQVLDLLNRENYSGAQIARIIETDPAIAQALLQHANGEWYEEEGSPPVSSLLAAARRVGAKGIHAAVMSVVLEGQCIRPGAGLDEIARTVWDHMVRVAPLSRQLAHGLGGDPDVGFTLGLCHDVGKLILFERIAEVRRSLRKDLAFPQGFLKAALKYLHEPLGGLAALAWNMPSEFVLAIASHHRTDPPEGRAPLSEALFLAEKLDLVVNAERDVDVETLWAEGAIPVPLETGRRVFERARQAAVSFALQERKAALEEAAAGA